ncbi:MAG: TrkH family potassium uptake protein [Bacteroidales bacterium]|nr:TrkH family potassium uptake protein [Bacteroidales bacterium]
MNWKVISRNIGYALLVSALFMLLSVGVSLLNGRDSALAALLISFLITFIVGIFPFIFVRETQAITLKEGYVIIFLSWLLSFIFGMLPYALWGGPFTLTNAWFESVSGYTTTGATILDDIEALPESLLFWRASTHFIGGLGVVVFLLLLIPGSNQMKMRLTNMELTSLSRGGYSSRTNKTVYIFAYVYLALLVLSFLAYMLAGMSVFDAACHAMSVSATGGFSSRNLSIAAFDSRWVEGITMVFMYLSSIHFGLVFLSVVTRSFKPYDNPVVKFYTASIAVVALVVGAGLKGHDICPTWGSAVWNGLFETLCVTSTSGFAILDNATWPLWIVMVLMFSAIMCGSAGSTSGGVKVDRIILLFKSIGRRINRILHPSSVDEIRMGKRVLREEEVSPHLLYLALYGLLLFLSVAVCLFIGVDHQNSFIASVTSLGNVGPAYGALGTMGSFNSVPLLGKLVFTLDMFLGRIEIYPVLAVVAMVFDKRARG